MINYQHKFIYITAIAVAISGCEMLGPKPHEKLPLNAKEEIDINGQEANIYQDLSNEGLEETNDTSIKTEIYPGAGEGFTNKKLASSLAPKNTTQGQYSLNFDDADLGEVAKVILTDILSVNYVLSPKVTGTVTLQTSNPLSKKELLPTLEMLLQLNDAVLVFNDGVYQIKSKADALNNSAFSTYDRYSQQIPAGYQIKVVPVRNVAVQELAEIIRPLLQDKTILNIDSNRNIMLVAGTSSELARAMEMVNAFDVDIMKGRSFGLFPIKNVEASKMIEELQQVFNQQNGSAANGFFQFMEIERLNSILAITHRPKFLKDIERWVIRLDRANASSGGGVIVYRVQHVDALELSGILNDIFSQSGSSGRRPAQISSRRETVEITNKNKPQTRDTNFRNNLANQSIADLGEIKIIPDEINNTLIVVATAQDYAVIHRVIKKLDVMPLQVLIDATIVEVALNDQLKYGIKWFLEHNNGQNAANSGGMIIDNAASLALAGATGGLSTAAGFGYGFVSSSGDIKAVLSAESLKGNINIISSPSIMVLNNQEGFIQVGEEKSLRTSESTNTSGGADDEIGRASCRERV